MAEPVATDAQRQYLHSLASHLARLISEGDPIASRVAREANLSSMTFDYAFRLIIAVEDAIKALEDGNVRVGPWGQQYEQH
jgi:hypothetical protein